MNVLQSSRVGAGTAGAGSARSRAGRGVKPAVLALAVQAALAAAPAWAQESKPELTLGEVKVQGTAAGITEGSGAYIADESAGSTGLGLSIRETPQSVTVITRQQLDDQNIHTMDEVLATTAGITFTEMDVGARTTYRARGGEISNYKIDGMAYNGATGFNSMGMAVNMDLYDRVDIVRGANGLLGGTGDASATIDLTRKRPGKTFGGKVGLQVGSWDQRRLVVDVNVPLVEDGSVRSRFVISSEQADSFRERQSTENYGALASFEMDLGSRTTLGAGLQHEKGYIKGATWGANVPIWFADGSKTSLSRKTNPVADWSYREVEATTAFARLEHRFDSGWKTELAAAQMWGATTSHLGVAKVNSTSGGYGGYWNQDGSGAVLNAFHSEGVNSMSTMDWKLSGPFELFGRTHELMLGYSSAWSESTAYGMRCSLNGVALASNCQSRISASAAIDDWDSWDGSFAPLLHSRTGAKTITRTYNHGGFLASRFSVADPLAVILGARVSTYRTYADAYTAAGAKTHGAPSGNKNVVTPYAGVVYDIDRNYSVYASYTDMFKPQSSQDVDGKYLDPITGASYEAGIKGEFLDGRLNASLAVFENEQQNMAEADGANLTPDGAQAYKAKGKGVKTNGFEIELAGALTPNWNIYGAYTYIDVDDPSTTAGRSDPRHLLRLNTTYRLPGEWNKLTVGGGMTAQSEIPTVSSPAGAPLSTSNGVTASAATKVTLPGYALFNAMARYQVDAKTDVALNISNLFDRTYYRRYGFYAGAIYGDPRRITLSLNTRF